jgi:Zn-dependent M28 family amino/carboxypeptidase
MKPKPLLLLFAFIATVQLYPQEQGLKAITAGESSKDMKYLSSDALEGRRTGSEGNNEAAAYISAAALEIGVKPLPGQESFFQPLKYLKVSAIKDEARITLTDSTGTILETCNITPLITPSDSVDLTGEVAFAGYGYLSSKDKYNDFAGLSFRDKIVIVMTRNPDLTGTGMPVKGEGLDGMIEARKLPFILMQQAKAVLFVADPALGADLADHMISFGSAYQLIPLFRKQFVSFDINAYAISKNTANLLLARAGLTLQHLQDSIAIEKKPASLIIPDLKAEVKVNVTKDTVTSSNIIGYIEGSDPGLKNECIMYTAHYDHVGKDDAGNIFNGANDNASGSVGLLNVARAFASLDKKPLRSIVFFWTTGEEEGLHGSSYYVDNPLFPLEKTIADINFDMIGRSRRETDSLASKQGKYDITGNDTIKIISSGENPDLVAIADKASKESGIVALDEGKGIHFAGSDHFPFYRKGIPVLFFFTGLHSDYHKETDDFEFIDMDKLVKVSKAGFLTGYALANNPGKPLKKKASK